MGTSIKWKQAAVESKRNCEQASIVSKRRLRASDIWELVTIRSKQ